MNEQQQQILEDRVSDALLQPLTDEQLEQLDRLMDNPNITEDQVENFIRTAGVDIEGITKKVTEDFMREQNLTPEQMQAAQLQSPISQQTSAQPQQPQPQTTQPPQPAPQPQPMQQPETSQANVQQAPVPDPVQPQAQTQVLPQQPLTQNAQPQQPQQQPTPTTPQDNTLQRN